MGEENSTCENTVLPHTDLPVWDLQVVGPGGAVGLEAASTGAIF